MNRLPEQLVAWHNRNPLARRITVDDVHTVGIVALPFMRSGSQAAAEQAEEPVGLQGIRPVFSERFLDSLSLPRIKRFAQTCGFATRPGDEAWPMRSVAADEQLIAEADSAGTTSPLELYLLSAAIDANVKHRTRVLIGQGAGDETLAVIGRRCLSPLRIGGLGLALLFVGGAAAAAAIWWPQGPAAQETAAVAATETNAAPVAAAAASASSAPASEPDPEPTAAPASAPEPASAPQAEAASEPTRDIRPRLVERVYPPRAKQPTQAMLSAPAPASAAASKPVEKTAQAQPDKAAEPPALASRISGKAKFNDTGANTSKSVVALVSAPSAKRADAEAMLERLRAAVGGAQGTSSTALQATVFQTPQGWCAAVWPFASREEAQIINATLVARGMRTRAVDF